MKRFKFNFIPNSLFWRLICVLFAGLLLAQLVSIFINYEDRGQLLSHNAGMQSAQRIADTVLLLDSLTPTERKHIISIINVPPQKVGLREQPIAENGQLTNNQPARTFAAQLVDALGDNRPIKVAQIAQVPQTPTDRTTPPATQQHNMGRGMGMRHGRQRSHAEDDDDENEEEIEAPPPRMMHNSRRTIPVSAASFLVQVQLMGGQWVAFDTYTFQTSATPPLKLLLTIAMLFIAVLALSFIAVRWLTQPLHQLAYAAQALGQDIDRPPLPETGPKEIRQAAHAFNTMQQQLKNFLQERNNIFAAMSHDLKTPITRLRLRAEMLDDNALRLRFEQDLKEMELMVTQTLDFMKGLDTKHPLQPIDMMALLESLQADYTDADKTVTLEGNAAQPFIGAAPLLKRCLMNLLDNACFYGQQAHIIVQDSKEQLVIRIQDKGPGIAQHEQAKAFEPFYRIEHSRSRETGGTGLGLHIVKNIIQSHGGTVTLSNLSQGGLDVTLVLPRNRYESQKVK